MTIVGRTTRVKVGEGVDDLKVELWGFRGTGAAVFALIEHRRRWQGKDRVDVCGSS